MAGRCPRCGGNLIVDWDTGTVNAPDAERVIKCLQCGYRQNRIAST